MGWGEGEVQQGQKPPPPKQCTKGVVNFVPWLACTFYYQVIFYNMDPRVEIQHLVCSLP